MKMPHTTDDREVNVHDAADVLRWTEELGVTELELRDGIRNVGPRVEDLKHALAKMELEQARSESPDSVPAEEGGKVRSQAVAPQQKP